MAIIIGVDVVVYAVCKCGRRFNPSPIHIKGVGFTKVLGVFCENVHGVCRLILPKVEGALCERDVGRVLVDFTKSRGFHKIVVNRVRVDFVKVQGGRL